ncbi:uncharacterized protein SETTUDRAFT_169317 [Exserohilum turcica Et28A]|uniref:Uncharacterized protein n=1 Tax=Exserohilum turcicum (strain 28A) TaxID=671987 RepID=R0IN59_EXST2|nr:uncharacterized protein SETTUDRAFT_169317 [Exserohilum turcica Et28A]EOA86211.1 hypothetical protein SETTUDRAFT_169317 [Exserohilum turcica Et28A]
MHLSVQHATGGTELSTKSDRIGPILAFSVSSTLPGRGGREFYASLFGSSGRYHDRHLQANGRSRSVKGRGSSGHYVLTLVMQPSRTRDVANRLLKGNSAGPMLVQS